MTYLATKRLTLRPIIFPMPMTEWYTLPCSRTRERLPLPTTYPIPYHLLSSHPISSPSISSHLIPSDRIASNRIALHRFPDQGRATVDRRHGDREAPGYGDGYARRHPSRRGDRDRLHR